MSSSIGYPTRYIETLFRAISPNKLDLQSVLSNITSATAAASAGPLDHFYARIGALNGPFFPAGWGNLSVVNYEEDLRHLIAGPPSNIKLSWRLLERGRRNGTDYLLYEGTFRTPCLQRVFDALPQESRTGRVQLLMPAHLKPFEPSSAAHSSTTSKRNALHKLTSPESSGGVFAGRAGSVAGEHSSYPYHAAGGVKPADAPACVVHLAATGDQTFGRRLRLAFPLLKDNVCALVLESPFYGARRPAAQRGSKLLRVSDLLTLGWATIAESVNLLHWLQEEGYGALGMCGLSMGGVHASMTAALFPGDVAVTPLLAPRSAAVAYCDGAMRAAMAWEPLLKEVDENNNRITQVVMAAGREVRIEIPSAAGLAETLGNCTSESPCQGRAKAVALMREATYALADLEVRGERRHLAVGLETGSGGSVVEPAAGGFGSGTSTRATAATIRAANVQEAEVSGAGAADVNASRGGLPFVSVMDLQSSLARAFLWGSGGDCARRGDGTVPAPATQGMVPSRHPQQDQEVNRVGSDGLTATREVMSCAAVAYSGDDYAGPFSGVIPHSQMLDPKSHAHDRLGSEDGPQLRPHSEQQHPHQHHTHRTSPVTTAAAAPPPGGHRPQPSPHQSDMPFPSPQLQQHPICGNAAEVTGVGGSSAIAGISGEGDVGSSNGSGTVIGRRLLGDLGRAVKQLRAGDRRLDRPDTAARLKQVLETYTDITRYPCPKRTDAAIIVAARDDAYVSPESVQQLHRYWQGSELRMVTGGHVSAFLMHQEAFREAIRNSLARVARPPPSVAG
ncbi:hypothetical protein Vretimale_1426 [Volvox reticuliferus]|uniref:Uncharacterized protein n=1 Tax=Volvox reticuliferus TaxID=1737510 RepID=A0A8J4D492_9CHLO|nr:hypothetical protein Vretifemale_10820 [Volvox reticuliferus]GIL95391.1 hypothetical protein Vretimale_1426 [Volvox reticuliferus]